MRDKCCGCGRIHDLDTACLDAAGGRIAQLEADMGSLQSHYAHEVSQRTALADELANANRRIEAHGPICLKWQYALHDADTRIRALEADIADVAKINVDLMKRNRELEARIERVRTVANTSGVRSEDMFDAVYSLLADAPQTETKGEQG